MSFAQLKKQQNQMVRKWMKMKTWKRGEFEWLKWVFLHPFLKDGFAHIDSTEETTHKLKKEFLLNFRATKSNGQKLNENLNIF